MNNIIFIIDYFASVSKNADNLLNGDSGALF